MNSTSLFCHFTKNSTAPKSKSTCIFLLSIQKTKRCCLRCEILGRHKTRFYKAQDQYLSPTKLHSKGVAQLFFKFYLFIYLFILYALTSETNHSLDFLFDLCFWCKTMHSLKKAGFILTRPNLWVSFESDWFYFLAASLVWFGLAVAFCARVNYNFFEFRSVFDSVLTLQGRIWLDPIFQK